MSISVSKEVSTLQTAMDQQDWKKLTLEELQHSLAEWAMPKSTSNHEHSLFRSEAIRHLLSYLNESPGRNSTKKNQFPKNLSAAYEYVLRVRCPVVA